MTTYRAVLRKPEMKAVFVAHAVSLTGSVAAEVALSVLVYRRTGSPLLSALTLGCAFVPQAFSAVLLSGLSDRLQPRRLLVGCDLLRALLALVMATPGTPVAALLALSAAMGVVSPLFNGTRAASLAEMLDSEHWVRARSLMRVLSQSTLLLGYAIGGLALAAVGSRVLLLVDAASFLGSAALLRWGTSERPPRSTDRPDVRAGLSAAGAALRSPVLRPLLLMTWLPSACVATIDGLATPYVVRRHGGPAEIGLLLALAAVGSVVAELLASRLDLPVRPWLIRPVAALSGIGLLCFLFQPPIWVAVLFALVTTLGGGVGQVLDGRLLAALPEDLRGRLFSLQGGFLMGIQGLGITVAGALAEVAAPQVVLAGAGVLDLLCVLLLLPRAARRDHDSRRTLNAQPLASVSEPS